MLKGKKILLGITGSIAAYKSIFLIRLLIKAGAEVKVVLTPTAKDFVSPLTVATLSKNPVLFDLFNENTWANHVMLGRWADLFIIVPASCNTIAKMANGFCDNLLLATYLSATCPVLLAPAMDEDMWHHPSTKLNLQKLKSFGNTIIPVNNGELASGLSGEGRMAEPEEILRFISTQYFAPKKLQGKKVMVTAGPTYEPIDPVRFVGNHSSGKMGIALANELQQQGATVTLILGPTTENIPVRSVNTIRVNTAAEMYNACVANFDEMNIAIMAAAVADYAPEEVADQKIKKKDEGFVLKLAKTKDILQSLGKKKKQQVLVGFALETENEKTNAVSKLKSKNADLIILNSLNDTGAGFGKDTNKISIFEKSGKEFHFETKSKQEVAADIVNTIIDLYYA